jgi:hypothetical protein
MNRAHCRDKSYFFGGAFRPAPEARKWLERNGEISHELVMHDNALEFEQPRGAQPTAEIGASADAAWSSGAIDALLEAARTRRENRRAVG